MLGPTAITIVVVDMGLPLTTTTTAITIVAVDMGLPLTTTTTTILMRTTIH